MPGVSWILAIIIGGIAGWVADIIMKTENSLWMNIVIGVGGAVILNALLVLLFGATWGGWIGQLIVAIIGACLLLWAFSAFRGRRTAH